jgi:hypothetical protein
MRLESLLALVVHWVDWCLIESASVLGAELQVWALLSFESRLLGWSLRLGWNILLCLPPRILDVLQIISQYIHISTKLRVWQLKYWFWFILLLRHRIALMLWSSSLKGHHIIIFILNMVACLLGWLENIPAWINAFLLLKIVHLLALMALQNALLLFCQICKGSLTGLLIFLNWILLLFKRSFEQWSDLRYLWSIINLNLFISFFFLLIFSISCPAL